MGIASKMAALAGPSQPPPASSSSNPFSDTGPTSTSSSTTAQAPHHQTTADPFQSDIPDEAPPAYTPAAASGDAHLAAGPNRMDFSGPPPMSQSAAPNRLENQITGVGVGYGPRRDHAGGGGFGSPSGPPPAPTMPPKHPTQNYAQSPSGGHSRPPLPMAGGAGPSSQDVTPTEVATPGRPLLRNGQLLVYPKGFMCHKCDNTGYKNFDPSNPHDTDWRKYGKRYTGALATSYTQSFDPRANPSTQSAQNFQRPLPHLGGPGQQALWHPQGHGVWDHPGNHRPPPPPMQQHGSFGPGPMMHGPPPPPPVIMNGGGWVPANAMVVHPGDPRLGGM